MVYVKWAIGLIIFAVVGVFFLYTLPQRDIVRIVDAYEKRMDIGPNGFFWGAPDAGTNFAVNRDVRFIDTVQANGKVMVYRNEDTGWSWPPYLKFDSSNLNAQAKVLVSPEDAPKWVAVTHYGWRVELFTIFPNAMSIREVEGPGTFLIPWFNIIFLTILALICLRIYRLIQRFRKRRIDPVLEDVGEAWDAVEGHAGAAHGQVSGVLGRVGAWLGTWKSKKRR